MAICDWPENERPREKLLQRGANALSDAELLAIFLRTGVAGCNAIELARKLLQEFGSLRALLGAEQAQFCQAHGLGRGQRHAPVVHLFGVLGHELLDDAVLQAVKRYHREPTARRKDLLRRLQPGDWLYINALHKHQELAEQVLTYRAFSDIAFNPDRSINCQAYAAALYVSLHDRGLLTPDVLKDKETYLDAIDTGVVSNAHENTAIQTRIHD